MTIMEFLTIVALLGSGASLVLAIVTIFFARAIEKDTRSNFEETQQLLAEIDKRATVTEKTVTETQNKLLETMTSIINQTVIPPKEDLGDQMGLAFMQMMMQDPAKAEKVLQTMMPLIEKGKESKKV